MKMTVSSLTIIILGLCHLSPIVCPNINDHLWTLHQLQSKPSSHIESVDNCNEQYSAANNIITVGDRSQSEVLKHSRDIDHILIDNIDFNEMDDLNRHSGSDATTFWSYFLNGMNDISDTKYAESGKHDSDTRRTTLKTVTSQQPHILNSSPKPSLMNSELGECCKLDQIEDPVLNPNTIIKHQSPQTKKRKHMDIIAGLEDEAHESHHTPSFLSSQISKQDGVEKEKPSWNQLQFRTVVNLLKWKGSSAIWHNSDVAKQIDSFFDGIDKNKYSSLLDQKGNPYAQDKFNVAVERVRTDVVLSYFGGLSIMFQVNTSRMTIEELVDKGWQYLKTYLNQEFFIDESDLGLLVLPPKKQCGYKFSRPFHLLHYVLKLGSQSSIHPMLIENLLSNWQKKFLFENTHYNNNPSANSLILAIVTEAELREKKVWNPTKLRKKEGLALKPIITSSSTRVPQVSEVNMDKINSVVHQGETVYLAKIGGYVLKNQNPFSKDVDKFFEMLESEMLQSLEILISSDFAALKISEGSETEIIDTSMIQNAIRNVKSYIIPAFMGCLFLVNNNWETENIFEHLLRTGFDTIKAFFSPWGEILIKERSSIILPTKAKAAHQVKWHNAKESLQYFCVSTFKGRVPTNPVWFLFEIWYENIIHQRYNMGEGPGIDPRLPPADVTNEILSFLEKNNIPFYRSHHHC
ncbi:hypothetical protein DFH28DRAFT_376933 [Melampsora americana]|nr:hypothetical protein DFH28DRAFT_376933 [Melampsora americana]